MYFLVCMFVIQKNNNVPKKNIINLLDSIFFSTCYVFAIDYLDCKWLDFRIGYIWSIIVFEIGNLLILWLNLHGAKLLSKIMEN